MEGTYEAVIKLPIGRKPCTVAITRNGDGAFDGEFTVSITNGKIDEDGNYTGECKITTILGTMEATTEGRIYDGKIDACAKCRLGVLPLKSKELW